MAALHPLGDLPHPIIVKAGSSFGEGNLCDNYVGLIAGSTKLPLYEIKVGQWRGGVWRDPKTGVHWLVVAGLAKGNHGDRDDFYEVVTRASDGSGWAAWEPTMEDERLLKRETAAKMLTDWELMVQRKVWEALTAVKDGGSVRFEVHHPSATRDLLAQIDLQIVPVREPDYEADEVQLEVSPTHRDGNLLWTLTMRLLTSLSPPEQDWDRFEDSYSNIAEPRAWQTRAEELGEKVSQGQLVESEPGQHSHYAHRRHIAQYTVEGLALRAACGVFFVPTQDHAAMPVCPKCSERMEVTSK